MPKQKTMPSEELLSLQHYVADIREAFTRGSLPDREKFRRSLSLHVSPPLTYTVIVDYGRLGKSLQKHKVGPTCHGIHQLRKKLKESTSWNYWVSVTQKRQLAFEVRLLPMGHKLLGPDGDKDGWNEADYEHLLAFGNTYPDVQLARPLFCADAFEFEMGHTEAWYLSKCGLPTTGWIRCIHEWGTLDITKKEWPPQSTRLQVRLIGAAAP